MPMTQQEAHALMESRPPAHWVPVCRMKCGSCPLDDRIAAGVWEGSCGISAID